MYIKINEKRKAVRDPIEVSMEDTMRHSINPETGKKIITDNLFVKPGENVTQKEWDQIFGR